VLTAFLALASAVPANAETPAEEGASAASAAANANNPLAKTQAFNVHNYYIPTLSEAPDQTADTAWLRYAQPFGRWLVRASLPFSRVPAADGTTSGLGDFNLFATYLFDTKPGTSFGVGPQVTAPTASEDETGTGQWQAGLAAVYFNATSPVVQWGGLVTWQTDVAGDEERPGTNVLAVQPFFFTMLGGGVYLRSAAVAVFNLETDDYNVPLGLGIGKIIPAGKVIFNLFVEPQYTVLEHGAGQPELQIYIGFNTQFVKK
jgi:hypothetical protein